MQEVLNTLMLICAAMGSLALGVLLAYGMTRVAFVGFRIRSKSVANEAVHKETVLHIS